MDETIPCTFDNGASLNVYMVNGGKPALIDSGIRSLPDRYITLFLRDREMTVQDLYAVLLTHGHEDHFGGNGGLCKLNPSLDFLIDRNDRSCAENFSVYFNELYGSLAGEWEPEPVFKAAALDLCGEAVPMNGTLEQDQRIDLDGVQLICHEVPGHSPGHVLFDLEEIAAIVCGDAIQDEGTLNGNTMVFPLYSDVDVYVRSLNRIRDLRPAFAATAHFGVLHAEEIYMRLDRSKKFADDLSDRILETIRLSSDSLRLRDIVRRTRERYYEHYHHNYQVHATIRAHCEALTRDGQLKASVEKGYPRWSIFH